MKISKQKLLQILKEEISPVSELSDTKISTTGMGTTKRIQQSRERIAATDPELTTQEAGILNQIEEFFPEINPPVIGENFPRIVFLNKLVFLCSKPINEL